LGNIQTSWTGAAAGASLVNPETVEVESEGIPEYFFGYIPLDVVKSIGFPITLGDNKSEQLLAICSSKSGIYIIGF
jgi:hypothetical protein